MPPYLAGMLNMSLDWSVVGYNVIFANDHWEQRKTNMMFKSPHLLRHIRGCSTEESPSFRHTIYVGGIG